MSLRYLKKFDTESEYQDFKGGGGLTLNLMYHL